MWVFAVAAWGADDPASEEIVVWGDRFLRWERRWYVRTEVVLPVPLVLLADQNHQFELAAVQVQAVLSCDQDFVLGAHSREVSCEIEDIGIVALPRIDGTHDEAVLAETDATLTGAVLQLQVDDGGGVPNVDLEGVHSHNQRGRTRQEVLRQLMSRVILPFHLQMPDTVYDGVAWPEHRSRLMSTPSLTASAGGPVLVHRLDRVGEWFVVQSVGHGVVTPDPDPLAPEFVDLRLTGVAWVDPDNGILTERVWTVTGAFTSGQAAFSHTGRLRMLGERDAPDVGPSRVMDRSAWVPMVP